MTSVQTLETTANAEQPRSLRALLDQHRAVGQVTSLADAVGLIVPLCVEIADIHRQGYGVYLHPSNVVESEGTFGLSSELAATPPQHPADLACMPPEYVPNEMGDAASSVYSVGAILYELVTGASAGRQMRRPSKLVPSLPPDFEVLLANALISDRQHRPDDLNALAEAIYKLVPPSATAAPPKANDQRVSLLALEVDVSLSMLPVDETGGPQLERLVPQIPKAPALGISPVATSAPIMAPQSQAIPASAGYNLGVVDARPLPQGDTATAELAAMKARLESDTSAHYVVIKDGMDHGPFSGVELLQQLGSHSFVAEDIIADQNTGQERPVADWPQFAPFAEHAQRHRDIQAEKVAIDQGVAHESKRTRSKALLGVLLLGLLGAAAGTWFLTQVGTRSDEVAVQTEAVANVEAEGDVKSGKKGIGAKGGKRRRVVSSQGGIPILAGGLSCEGARAAYVEELSMKGGKADITRGQYGGIMNSGAYFSHCGVPSNVGISICAAVQNGRAVGVTVSTKPRHKSRGCVSSAVRKLRFPSHPKLDVVRVNFAAQ